MWSALYAASCCVETKSEIAGVTNVTQWFDYAPYGSVIATTNTGQSAAARGYIGQFSDQSGLSYLNARYYNPAQGQFITQDPVFWGTQNLPNAKSNPYSYANDNPITSKDPTGQSPLTDLYTKLIGALTQLCQALGGCGSGSGGGSVPVSPSKGTTGGSSGQQSSGSSGIGAGGGTWVSQYTFPNPDTGCLRACQKMAGYDQFGTPINTATISGDTLTIGTDAKKGVETIDAYLAENRKIIVGVNWSKGTQEGNNNPASQHFVTIDYSGEDSNGKSFPTLWILEHIARV